MKNCVHRPGHVDVLRDILFCELESGMREQMRYVRIGAGDEVIEAQNLPSFLDKEIADM